VQYSVILASFEKVFPFKSSLITVGIPPTFVDIQGTPKEFASQNTIPNASALEGKIKKWDSANKLIILFSPLSVDLLINPRDLMKLGIGSSMVG